MKINKLLKIILVTPTYIVVDNNGCNERISIRDSKYKIGDVYETEEIEKQPEPLFKKNKYTNKNDDFVHLDEK
jgi:hypothetical protein